MSKEVDIKSLQITARTSNRGKDIAKFMPLIEMIARKEYGARKGSNILSYDEMVNTGLIAVNSLIEQAKAKEDTTYNSSYIAQSVKWSITDELRKRQGWYGVKTSQPKQADAKAAPAPATKKEKDTSEITVINTMDDARAAVFEVIMSVDSMNEDGGFSPESDDEDHLDKLALMSMKESLKKSISKLPGNLKQCVQLRFYEHKSGNEVAQLMNVTPSRVSHMIREATKKLRVLMVAEGYNEPPDI